MITERSREQTDEKQRKTSKNTESEKVTKVQKKRFEKRWKKLLTNGWTCDKMSELPLRRQQRTLKTEQYVKPWKFLKNKGFWLSLEVRENIQNKKTKQQ